MADEQVVFTTASHQQVSEFVRSIPGRLAGTTADPERIGDAFRARLAFAWYSLVAAEFDRLGRGQPGDDGRVWPPNSKEYLAYGKGPASSRSGSGEMPNNFPGGPSSNGKLGRAPGTSYLTPEQLQQWWAIYMPIRNQLLKAGWPVRWAKAIAASRAWEQMKKRGARTKLQVLGNRRDQVLVDRGQLRRSLEPGFLGAADYQPQPDQIFREQPSRLVVGSKDKKAYYHHNGKGVPERRLWPSDMPDEWWEEIIDQAASGLDTIGEVVFSR